MVCLNIANWLKQKISKYCRMEHWEKFLPASILLGKVFVIDGVPVQWEPGRGEKAFLIPRSPTLPCFLNPFIPSI